MGDQLTLTGVKQEPWADSMRLGSREETVFVDSVSHAHETIAPRFGDGRGLDCYAARGRKTLQEPVEAFGARESARYK